MRGLQRSIVKLARARCEKLRLQGKTVKILTVGKKGREQLRRDHRTEFVSTSICRDVKRVGYANAQ